MNQTPTLEEWKALYGAAVTFRDLAPWAWMDDDGFFAVQNPEDGEMGYCSVMGALGEFHALGVYRGPLGWASLQQICNGAIGVENSEVQFSQKALMASFEASGGVDKRDREIFGKLGLHFRGKYAWPVVRSYEPGYLPWYLTGPEVRFLTIALEQVVEVANRIRENAGLLTPSDAKFIFTRTFKGDLQRGGWTDAWTQLPDDRIEASVPVVVVDETRVRRLIRRAKPTGAWEIDFTMAPFAVHEGERPMYPRLLMCVDSHSGMILQVHAAAEQDYGAEFVDRLLKTMETAAMYPKKFVCMREHVAQLFQPLAQIVGAEVYVTKRLPMLEEARTGLLESMR